MQRDSRSESAAGRRRPYECKTGRPLEPFRGHPGRLIREPPSERRQSPARGKSWETHNFTPQTTLYGKALPGNKGRPAPSLGHGTLSQWGIIVGTRAGLDADLGFEVVAGQGNQR